MKRHGGGYGTPLAVLDYLPAHPVGFQDTTGKVVVDSAVVPGEKTGIFLVAGQSLGSNTCFGALYTPVNLKVHNFNIYDRKTYQAADPLLGCVNNAGNFITEMADMLITAGTFQRVILIPVGRGGTSVAQWGYGGIYNHLLQVAVRCLPLFGAPLTGGLLVHGEENNLLGTSQADYAEGIKQVVSTIRAMGCNAPIFMPRESYINGSQSAAVRAAQAASVDSVSIFAGPDMDTIPPSERQPSDGVHLLATGRHHAASMWQAILSARFA